MRANDPLYEASMIVAGHRKEDKFWTATLTALGSASASPSRRST